jgi:uncharacterized protein (DUF1697 family)
VTVFVGLLRAVNVGGTGKLPMADLREICAGLGFTDVRTYIASGNVVFTSDLSAAEVQAALEKALATYAGRPVGVMIRTGEELAAVLSQQPFPDAPPNRVMTIFLDHLPAADPLANVSGQRDELLAVGEREIYAYYPTGMGDSKLKIPAAKTGTARNINTVAALVKMASQPN